ncbi:hypothetical protein PMAC_002020 [Pneumocystis sp. 'macacae']|nr:hypothetical protein PMAC_002020 [Pneumocystis sp. 'macacae']
MTLKLSKDTLCFEEYENKISTASILVKNPSLKHRVAFNLQINPISDYYTAHPSIAMLDPDSECQISFERYPKDKFYEHDQVHDSIDIFVIQSIEINNKMNKKLDKMEKNDKMLWNYLENEVQKNYKKIRMKEIMLSVHVNDKFNLHKFDKPITQELTITKKESFNDTLITINDFSIIPTKLPENSMLMKNCTEYVCQKKEFLNSPKTSETLISISKEYSTQSESSKYTNLSKDNYDLVLKHKDLSQGLQNAFLCSTETISTQISDNTAITVVDLSNAHKGFSEKENDDDSSEFWSDNDSVDNEISLEYLETNFNIVDPEKYEKNFNKGIEHLQVWKLIREQNQDKFANKSIIKDDFSNEDLVLSSVVLKQPFLTSTIPDDLSPSLLSLSHKSSETVLSQNMDYAYIQSFSYKEFNDSIGRTLFGVESTPCSFIQSDTNISLTPIWIQSILDLQKELQAIIDEFDRKISFRIEDFDFIGYNALQKNTLEGHQESILDNHCTLPV